MSNSKTATDKNESSVVHPGASKLDYLGKETAYADTFSYGQASYLGQKLSNESLKDQIRSDFGLLWSKDTIMLGQNIGSEHNLLSFYKQFLEISLGGSFNNPYMPPMTKISNVILNNTSDKAIAGNSFNGITHHELYTTITNFGSGYFNFGPQSGPVGQPDLKYRNINNQEFDDFFDVMFSSDGAGASSYKKGMPRNGQQMLLHIRFSQLSYDEYVDHYLSLVANDAQHPGKAEAFFRSNFIGPWHAKYVYHNEDPPAEVPSYLKHDHHNNLYTQENLNKEINLINLHKQYYPKPLGNGILNGSKIYEDYYIRVDAPLHKEEVQNINGAPRANELNVEVGYNFYDHAYETKTNEMNLDDDPKQLPNMYLMLQNEYQDETDLELNNLVTVNQTLSDDKVVFLNDNGEKEEVQVDPTYFKDWAMAHNNALSDNTPGYIEKTQRNQNLIFLMDESNYLKDFNKYSKKFPMANTISFSAMRNNPIADSLKKTRIDFGLLRTIEIINNNPENFYDVLPAFENKTMIKATHVLNKNDNDDIVENTTAINSRQIKSIDIETWLQQYFQSGDDYLSNLAISPNQFVRVLGRNIASAGLINNAPQFLRKLTSIVFNSKLNQEAKKYLRTHQDILRGIPAHHEIIAYRVAKHKVNSGEIAANPEQNFYIANADELDEIIYHDTQVTYKLDGYTH